MFGKGRTNDLADFIATNKSDILSLSEIFLDAAIGLNDENMNLKGHSILRVDHPINSICGGISMYFKQPLPIIRRDDISKTQEMLVTGISVNINPNLGVAE